jgi:hypothetical protein
MNKQKQSYEKYGVLKVPQQEDISWGTPCLLCGKIISIPNPAHAPKICDECKEMWKRLKELQNG